MLRNTHWTLLAGISAALMLAVSSLTGDDDVPEAQASPEPSVVTAESEPISVESVLAPPAAPRSVAPSEPAGTEPGVVRCANLIYGENQSSVCFADEFLTQVRKDTNIRTSRRFTPVKVASLDLFDHPFSVMTGEGSFLMSSTQRENMRQYLTAGGFIIASAGCSSSEWNDAFKREIKQVFPKAELKKLPADHPVFHTVYDIASSKYKSSEARLPDLYGLELDGRVVLIHSPDGLNDTANAGGNCCCCGGNEIKSARQLNVNILTYALTH